MARIISIPPAPAAAGGGGLSGNLVAGLVGDRVIDPFLVADNNNITGQFLRDLIGSAFDAHRTLQAMNAVAASATAMNAVAASATAMTAVAASATAMNAVAASATARTAVRGSTVAMTAVGAVNMAIGKFAAGEAGLDPTAWADMTAVAASSTAMNAVLASATAMTAVAASSTAMNAVAASATAMSAVAASLTARSAVRQSAIAINAISAAQSALDIMYTAAVKFTHTGHAWSANPATLVGTGNYLIVRFTQVAAFWAAGTVEGQYLRRGDLSTWIMTDGDNTADIPTRASGTRRDNALRAVNNTSIQYYLGETFEIAYLTA